VTNEAHATIVEKQLEAIDVSPQLIILEPLGRNTAPALALAALAADPGDTLLVMPSDHLILNEVAFHAAVAAGSGLARRGWLVTFGINLR